MEKRKVGNFQIMGMDEYMNDVLSESNN